ncbi:MAG: class I SAM-dependent methyltransferase [Blastocatellia bacterium]
MTTLVNIGCGPVFHPDWINLDLVSRSTDVVEHDLTRGLPFEAGTVDACYSSHVLEHLRPEEARFFLEEQRRVLKPGGILRVVVPDLEAISRLYLDSLAAVASGTDGAEFKYDYSLLELYDQTTRERSGGELLKVWTSEKLGEREIEYILHRHGREAEEAIRALRAPTGGAPPARRRLRETLDRARTFAAESAVSLLLGRKSLRAFREGRFRNAGEIHRVMYDRYSLRRLLASRGFTEITACDAEQSRIPAFSTYRLDSIDGETRKPDSLFMEAVRA